ncbi:hypothetical protein [Dermatophilus congolensis]|nr:hypothetical protein [Dermatophilus congolensis]
MGGDGYVVAAALAGMGVWRMLFLWIGMSVAGFGAGRASFA